MELNLYSGFIYMKYVFLVRQHLWDVNSSSQWLQLVKLMINSVKSFKTLNSHRPSQIRLHLPYVRTQIHRYTETISLSLTTESTSGWVSVKIWAENFQLTSAFGVTYIKNTPKQLFFIGPGVARGYIFLAIISSLFPPYQKKKFANPDAFMC